MADSTIDSERIVLAMGRFGAPRMTALPADVDDLANSYTHNVATATEARVGDVIAVYNDGTTGIAGWSEFVYGQAVANADVTIAAKQVMVQDAAGSPLKFTNDPDDAVLTGGTGDPRAVVAISAMTTLYYGWFWCGGVVPEQLISGMGGNYATDDNVAAGPIVSHNLDADAIGLGPCGADTEAIIGFAEAADA